MHSYYALGSRPRCEEKALATLGPKLEIFGAKLFLPRRELFIRKNSKVVRQLSPLFPGYVFLETQEPNPALFREIYQHYPTVWFIKMSDQPTPLSNRDVETLKKFLQFGEIIRPSIVTFEESQKIKVVQGPMLGLEGKIIKVDRRKQRARICIEFNGNQFQIDLAFELMEHIKT